MRRQQAGQALVGALVVTTLAFLMAGTVAVGASALLSQESNSKNASSRDLTAQDALAAAVAGVAGKGSSDGSAPCSQPMVLGVTVLPSGYPSQALCERVDGVPAGQLTLLRLPWSAGCAVVDVSTYSNSRILLWFSATGNASAWVDTSPSGCKRKKPLCADSAAGSVTQLLLDCDFTENQEGNENRNGNGKGNGNNTELYLHVQNAGQSPVLARLAQYASSGGSIYVLAASTGIAGGPAYEVADIWVSADGATTALRFEGTL